MEMALKSLNPLKLFDIIFGHNGDSVLEEPQVNSKYPLKELEKYVGKVIEVHYIGREPERSILRFPPNDEFFYLKNKEGSYTIPGDISGYHILYWNRTNGDERSAVKLIKDEHGNEIYRNDEFPFKVKE